MFKKGVSGNPSGRPKDFNEVKKYAQQFTIEAIDNLVRLMRNEKDSRTSLHAAEALLDRAIGKATQAVEHSGTIEQSIINVPNQETMEQWIARKMQQHQIQ